MRSVVMFGMMALCAAGVAYGQVNIVYSLELGGDNNAAGWEANNQTTFTAGTTNDTTKVDQNGVLTWAARVTVTGTSLGAANLVFDLELHSGTPTGPLVSVGAATMTCQTGTAGQSSAKVCAPSTAGFFSTVNDGDSDNLRTDFLANGAFAKALTNQITGGATRVRVIDPVAVPGTVGIADGPNFDYGWYPTANGRGGPDLTGAKLNTTVTCTLGKLLGFGAGYKSYEYTNYRPGVYGYGVASGAQRPVFEGQLSTAGLPLGTYYLVIVPSATGNNELKSTVIWSSPTPDYSGSGTFAAQATVTGTEADLAEKFEIVLPAPPSASIEGRYVFYNMSKYDGNRVALDTAIIAGVRNDDSDAIDTTKYPLLPGGGSAIFANMTSYSKGINGLMFDVKGASRDLTLADFTFTNAGKLGTATVAVAKTGMAIVKVAGVGVNSSDRYAISIPANLVQKTWLKVDIAATDMTWTTDVIKGQKTCYWANAIGECNTWTGIAPNVYMTINATDELNARNNPMINPATPTAVSSIWDYNKDGLVNASDQLVARGNKDTTPTSGVKAIVK